MDSYLFPDGICVKVNVTNPVVIWTPISLSSKMLLFPSHRIWIFIFLLIGLLFLFLSFHNTVFLFTYILLHSFTMQVFPDLYFFSFLFFLISFCVISDQFKTLKNIFLSPKKLWQCPVCFPWKLFKIINLPFRNGHRICYSTWHEWIKFDYSAVAFNHSVFITTMGNRRKHSWPCIFLFLRSFIHNFNSPLFYLHFPIEI